MPASRLPLLTLALTLLAAAPGPAAAQGGGWLDRAKKVTKGVMDAGERKAPPATPTSTPAAGAAAGAGTADGAPPAAGPNAGFDFTPGTRVIFAEDFSDDAVGDFPRRLEVVRGNGEVAEWRGRRWLRVADDMEFAIPLPETLPQQFTLEFDYFGSGGNSARIYFDRVGYDKGRNAMAYFVTHTGGVEFYGGASSTGKPKERLDGTVFPVRLMADGKHVKMYMGNTRVANAPNMELGRTNRIIVKVPGNGDLGAFVGNIRIAAGGKDLYDALASEGRVTAEGIFFDTGSDRLKPESRPALDQIARMLAAHAELSLTIEGHTDDVGGAAANLALSDKRAAAVRAYLMETHRIAAARLTSKGFGATRPAAPNDTPENRARNRRVELVKR